MEDKLIQILERSGYPVYKQGSLSDDEDYPEAFFTFWNNETIEGALYDNENYSEIGDFDVNFYSSDPEQVYSELNKAKKELKQNGYIITDAGHDIASDEPTHTGRGINVLVEQYQF